MKILSRLMIAFLLIALISVGSYSQSQIGKDKHKPGKHKGDKHKPEKLRTDKHKPEKHKGDKHKPEKFKHKDDKQAWKQEQRSKFGR